MWTLFCNVCINFLNSQIWKEIMLELNCKPSKCYHSSVTMFSMDISSQLGFLEFIWIFSGRNHLKIQYLPHSESKSYQIKYIKSCWQDFSNNTEGTFQFQKISATIYFNFQWGNHSIFKNFCTTSPNIMEPSPCTPPHQELSKDTKNTIWSIPVQQISELQNKTKQEKTH
jgi:hypothetical protein